MELPQPMHGATMNRTWTDQAFELISVILMTLMVVSVFVSTASRYVFNASVIWSEEAPILLQVWLTFLAGILALRRGEHVSVDVFLKLLPARWPPILGAIVEILSLGLMLVLVWMGTQLVEARAGEVSGAVGFPMSLFMLPLAIGAAFMALTICRRLMDVPPWILGAAALIIAGAACLLMGIQWSTGGVLARVSPLALLLGGFALLVIIGMPIAFAFGVASVIHLWFAGFGSLTIIAQRLVAGPTSFVLIAVPLFILAGALMEVGGISRRLIAFAGAMVGHIRGGLAMVVIMSEILFSGISGLRQPMFRLSAPS